MKVPLIPLLWCICVILLATLQSPTRAEEFFVEEEVTMKKIIVQEENEQAYMDAEDNPIVDNFDDVAEAKNICSRYSPKEVFHTIINPHLFKILDEMNTFMEAVLHHVEAALHTLTPHVDQSPIGELRVEELFLEVQTFMVGTMRGVYDLLRQAWRELIIAYIHKPSSPQHTLVALTHVIESQSEGEKQLVASLQEFSVLIKSIVLNSVYVIQKSLHIPNNTDDHEAALAISQELPKIAPNFLGTVIYKLLRRGNDIGSYETVFNSPMRSIIPLVEKMHVELKATINKKEEMGEEEEDEEAMEAFWMAAVEASHHHLEEWPLLDEDFQIIYSNEEYLSEVLLQLITTF